MSQRTSNQENSLPTSKERNLLPIMREMLDVAIRSGRTVTMSAENCRWVIDELDRQRAEIQDLRLQVESLQNRWATRPLSRDDGDALAAENDRLRAALERAHAVIRKCVTAGVLRQDLNQFLADESEHRESSDETGNDLLEKARTVLASAYQAVGCLVHPEPDIVPSEADQTRLLDMLSRWEDWSLKQVEEFLPWPKDWSAQSESDGRD